MLLHYFLDLLDHDGFIVNSLGEPIDGEVLVEPDPTESLLIDGDHVFPDFEGAESIIKPLEADDRLLEDVEGLSQVHLVDSVELEGTVLVVDYEFDDVSGLEIIWLDAYILCFHDREFRLIAPFVDLQVGKKLCLLHGRSVRFDAHFFAAFVVQLVLAAGRGGRNQQVLGRQIQHRDGKLGASLAAFHFNITKQIK